jgi:S-adenosylmethionine decarboxylase
VGVSGVVLIAESHFAFHTWPEENYAAFDIFTCGPTMNVDAAVEYLKQHLSCKDLTTHKIERGVKSGLP